MPLTTTWALILFWAQSITTVPGYTSLEQCTAAGNAFKLVRTNRWGGADFNCIAVR